MMQKNNSLNIRGAVRLRNLNIPRN